MVRKVRRWSIAAALMLMVGLVLVPAVGSAGNDKDHKTYVCHTTESVNNPWVIIWIDESGWENGHDGQHVRSNGNFDWEIGAALPEGVTKHDADVYCEDNMPTGTPTVLPPTEAEPIAPCDPDAPLGDEFYGETSDGAGGTCFYPAPDIIG